MRVCKAGAAPGAFNAAGAWAVSLFINDDEVNMMSTPSG
jgi:hypothetical protein